MLPLFPPRESSHCGGSQTPKSIAGSWFTALRTSRTSAAWPRQKCAVTSTQRPMTSCHRRPGGAGPAQRKWNRKRVSCVSHKLRLCSEGKVFGRVGGLREVTNRKTARGSALAEPYRGGVDDAGGQDAFEVEEGGGCSEAEHVGVIPLFTIIKGFYL